MAKQLRTQEGKANENRAAQNAPVYPAGIRLRRCHFLHSQLRQRMSSEARKVVETYSEEVVMRKWLELFDEVVEGKENKEFKEKKEIRESEER